jgi:hypothetical protein
MEAAMNSWQSFRGNSESFKIDSQQEMSDFIWWCANEKKLKHSTICTYVSSLGTLQKIQNVERSFSNSYITKSILKGVRNIEAAKNENTAKRQVLTLPLLKVLGHCIMSQDWELNSKIVFWSACKVLFFGSFRISEILANNENSYNPLTTLLWEDIDMIGDALRIHVKFPKIFSPNGIHVDLFPICESSLCPVTSLKSLRKGITNTNEPVFKFSSGKLLSPATFNRILKNLLFTVLSLEENVFSSHSFRAAIPAALAENPLLASREDLANWGRWDSTAYLKYTRLKYSQRVNSGPVI